MASYKKSVRQISAVAFLLTFVGLLCQMVAVFSPAWFYTERKKIIDQHSPEPQMSNWYLYEGIWLAKFCQKGVTSSCSLDTREKVFSNINISESLSPLDESHWMEFKILSCVSIFGSVVCLITCLLALVTVKSAKKQRICRHNAVLISACTGAIISFSTLLIPALKLCALLHDDQFTSSWSMIVALLGCALQFLAATAIIVAFLKNVHQLLRLERRRELRSRRLEHTILMTHYPDGRERTTASRFPSDRQDGVISVISSGHLSSDVNRGINETVESFPRLPPYSETDALPAYSEITGV